MDLPYDLVTTDRPKLGLIVLQADETIEHDMRRMIPDCTDLLVSRVRSDAAVTSDSLAQMAKVLTQSASLFPAGAQFASIGYGCTSGTAEIGASAIAKLIGKGVETRHVTEPVSALVAACRKLKITRIGLVSPYIAQVSDRLVRVLATAGITVADFASFNEAQEAKVVRIAPTSIAAAATEMAQRGNCEAVFLSCTNLRTLDVIAGVEAATRLPILSSNQVLAWHLLQQADIGARALTPGQLWSV